jgi:signal transduction histidine kinase
MYEIAEPVALMMLGILGNVVDYDQARAIVDRLVSALPSGSYLVVNDGGLHQPVATGCPRAGRGGCLLRGGTEAMIDTTGGAGDRTDGGDTLAVIWQTCVHLRFPDGQLRQMAGYFATSARRPGTARRRRLPDHAQGRGDLSVADALTQRGAVRLTVPSASPRRFAPNDDETPGTMRRGVSAAVLRWLYVERRGGPYGEVVTIPSLGVRWPVDVAVAAVVAGLTGMDAWWNQPDTRAADQWTYLLVVVSVAAVLVRRRWPMVVAVVCGAALTAWYVLGHRGELLNLPSMVALYTVAVQGARRRTVLVGVVAVLWSAGLGWVVGDRSSAPATDLLWPAVALLLGEVVRGRSELLDEYTARQQRAAVDRDEEAHRRVQKERLRIAREFHDVVAHTMAAVNVQTAVAVAAFDQRPEAARAALVQARASSREALQELRATVAVLRDVAPGDSTEPAPSLVQLDALVARTNGAGVDISLHRDTGGRDLPAVVELAAYRIVQEALTNVIRHADAGAAAVSVTCEGDVVVVEVVDDGRGDTSSVMATGGYGLTGMAERAAAIGGRVDWGPAPGGGFRVRAVLPVGECLP